MARIPTIKVKEDGRTAVINESEFDFQRHEPTDERGRQIAEQQRRAKEAEGVKKPVPQGTPTSLPASPEGAPDPSIKNTPDEKPSQPVAGGAAPTGTTKATTTTAPAAPPASPSGGGTIK